jgi:hypothetical protein
LLDHSEAGDPLNIVLLDHDRRCLVKIGCV